MPTISEIIEAKKSDASGPVWTAATISSRSIIGVLQARTQKGNTAPAIRLAIIDSETAADSLIESAGMQAAATEADAHAVKTWLERNLSTLEDATTDRMFLPFESVSLIESDARAFIMRTIKERKRAEREEAGAKLIAAAAKKGMSGDDLLEAAIKMIEEPAVKS